MAVNKMVDNIEFDGGLACLSQVFMETVFSPYAECLAMIDLRCDKLPLATSTSELFS
ncbi:MAG: hypothetical protein R3C56_09845 [Pirellulaceae bacterium]